MFTRYADDVVISDAVEAPITKHPPFVDQEWTVDNLECTTYQKPIPDEPNENYTYANCELSFTRRPTYYIYTTIVPSVVVTATAIMGMFLPFETSGKRRVSFLSRKW